MTYYVYMHKSRFSHRPCPQALAAALGKVSLTYISIYLHLSIYLCVYQSIYYIMYKTGNR